MSESVGRLEATFSVDLTPLQRGLKQASSLMAAWAKRHDEDPKASVGLDTGPFQRGLRRADGMLQSFDGKEATANLRVNLTGLQQGLREGSRRLSEFDGKKAEARVTADTSSATRSFNSLRRQLSDLSRESGNISVSADTTQARNTIRQLVQWAGNQSASVDAGANTSDARQTVASLVRSINSRSASIAIGAKTQDARREVERFIQWVKEQRAEFTITAATGDAQSAAESLKAYIDSLSARIDVGASTAAAIAEGRLAAGRINSMSPEFDVGAETAGAMGKVQGIVSRVNGMRGDVNVGANTTPASTELAGFNQVIRRYSKSWGSQGLRVRVQSDTRQAQAQVRNLERVARSVTDPEYKMRVEAEAMRARGQLRGLQQIATGLGMQNPTVSVGVRGAAASAAQMVGLYALADRLDGYNIKIGASVDNNLSRAIPAMLGDLGQQLARFKSIATTVAAVTVPAFYTSLSMLPAAFSMAATAAGAFATRLGAGVVGAMGSVGSAAILGGGALGVYGMALRKTAQYAFNLGGMLKDQKDRVDDATDGVKLAKAAVESATPGTREYANAVKGVALAEQNLEYETKKFNAILEATTPAMMKMNKEAGNLHIEFIRLGGAVANKTAPIMTSWIQGMTRLLPTLRPHIISMVGDMNKVSASFVKTMSKGRELKNLTTIMSGIKSAGVPALTTLTNVARMFVNVFAAMVPAGLKVLGVMARATTAAAKWTGSAEGQKRIGTVWQGLATAGAQLWRIIRDLSIGMAGVVVALNATGIGQGMMAGLEGIASGFRKASGEGGKVRQVVTEMGKYTKPVLGAIANLVKGVATQFGLMAMEVGKSGLMVDVVNAFNDALLGTKDGQGIIAMLRHEFKEIGPLLPPLITALGNWFSTFAQSEPEMVLFIKTFTKILEAFNSLPEPIKRGIARTIAWSSALNALGAGALPGVIAQVYFLNKANKVANLAMGAMGAQSATQVGILGRMKLAVAAAATRIQLMTVAVWKYIASSRVAALSMRAMGIAATFMLGPWGLVIAGVVALGAALVIAYRRSETFRNAVNALGNFLKGTAIAAFRGLISAARAVWQWFQRLPAPIQALISPIGALVANFGRIRSVVASAAGVVGRFVANLAAQRVRQYGEVLGFLWNAIKPVVQWLGRAAVAVGVFIAKLVSQRVRQYGTVLGFLWNAIKPVVQWLGRAAVAVGVFVAKLVGQRVRQFGAVLGFLWNAVKPVVQWLGRAAAAVGRFIAKMVVAGVKAFGRVLGFLWNAVKPVVMWLGRAAVAVGKFVTRTSGVAGVKAFGRVLGFLWNAAKPVVTWLGKAAVAVGKFLAKLVMAGIRAFVAGLKTIYNGAKTLIRWIGEGARAVGRFATAVLNGASKMRQTWTQFWSWAKNLWDSALRAIGNRVKAWATAVKNTFTSTAKAVRSRWNDFWAGLKGLWDRSLTAIGNRTGVWRDALRRLMDSIAKAVRQRWNDFWSGLKGLWDRSFTAIGNRTEKWRDALRRLMDSIAKAVRQRWDDFWSGLKGLWDRSFTAIGNRTEKWRDALRNLMDSIAKKVRGRWDSFWEGFRGLWDRSLTAVGDRLRSWGSAVKSLFGNMVDAARSFGDNFRDALVNKVSGAVNKVREWLGGLAMALANVLKALGMNGPAGDLRGRGEKLQAPLQFARGGIARAKDGPGIVGEAGDDEAVVNLRRKTPESQDALRQALRSPNAPSHRDGYGRGGGPNMQDATTDSRGKPWIPPKNPQHGGGPGYPPINFTPTRNWNDEAYGYVKKIESKFPSTFVNTYRGHGQFPGGEAQSWDVWGPGQSHISNAPDAQSQAYGFIDKLIGAREKYMIYKGKVSTGYPIQYGGPHYDHIHTSIVGPGEEGKNRGGGGGFFSGVMDSLGNAYNSVKDFIGQKFKPPEIPSLGMGPFGTALTGGLKDMVLGGATKYVTKLAEEKLSIGDSGGGGGSGSPAPEGSVKDWIKAGFTMGGAFPPSDKNINTIYGRVMQESGGNPKAVNNWDSNAKAGTPSKGLLQIIEPTWNANTTDKIGQFASNWSDPVKSVAVSSRYMKNQYGRVVGSSSTGYAKGGVIPGKGPKSIMAHGGERVIPKDLNTGFESLARSIEIWSARSDSATITDSGEGRNAEKVLKRIEAVLERQEAKMMTEEGLSRAQVRAVKDTISSGASDAELQHRLLEALS